MTTNNQTPQSTGQDPRTTSSIQSEEPTLSIDENLLTFEDTVGLEEAEPSPEQRDDDQNPYLSPHIETLLARPFKLFTKMWSSSNPARTRLEYFDIAKQWLSIPYVAQVLSKFKYFACDFEISFLLQSTAMHYGKVLLTWLPVCPTNPSANTSLESMYALDPFYVDANNRETLKFTCDFKYPMKWWNIRDFTANSENGRGPGLFMYVAAPLGNNQAESTEVPYTFYVSATNLRVAGPINSNSLTSMAVLQSETRSPMGERARERGYVRSVTDSTPSYVSVRQAASVGQSHEDDSTVRLSMAASNTMDISKKMVQASLTEEHNLINVCKKPSLLDIITITPSTSGNFWSAPVVPTYSPQRDGKCQLTNMQVVSRMVQYWHGSLKYLFSFTASAFSTIRVALVVSYDDTLAIPLTTDNLVAAVWDITGSMDKTVEIPYLSMFPYARIDNNQQPYVSTAVSQGLPTINLVIINPLTNGAIATVSPDMYCLVHVAAGDDFRLFLPTGFAGNDELSYSNVFNQDNLGALFARPFEIPGGDTEVPALPDYNFGEELLDFLDIMCRYHDRGVLTVDSAQNRSLPDAYKGLYRFARYGVRYKVWETDDQTEAKYQCAWNGVRLGSLPPRDIVFNPTKPIGQFELPYYEPVYSDIPTSRTSSAIKFELTNGKTYTYATSVSADSVFSFWTMARVWTNPSP